MKRIVRLIVSSVLCLAMLIGFEIPVSATELPAEDPQQVYQELMDTVSFIENDSSWDSILIEIPFNTEEEAKQYALTVNHEGKTDEEAIAEYKNMSKYERFIYYRTYIFMAQAIANGNYEDISTYEKLSTYSSSPLRLMRGEYLQLNNKEEVIAAFEKVLHWQFDYIQATGGPYNFITGKSYAEEMGLDAQPAVEEKEDKTAEEEFAEAQNEIKKEYEKQEGKKEKGIWDDTLDSLSGNLVTILILAVVLIALGVVIYIKKKNNYSDEVHEK